MSDEERNKIVSLLNSLSSDYAVSEKQVFQELRQLSMDYLTFRCAKKEITYLSNRKKEMLKENVNASLKLKENSIVSIETFVNQGFIPIITMLFGILFGLIASSSAKIREDKINLVIAAMILLLAAVFVICFFYYCIYRKRKVNNIYYLKLIEYVQMLDSSKENTKTN